MMNKTLLFSISLILVLLIAACEGDKPTATDTDSTTTDTTTNTQNDAPAINGTMSAKVAGEKWTATQTRADYIDGTLTIIGTAANGSKFTLEIGDEPEIGIFPISDRKLQAAKFSNANTTYYCPFNNTIGVINLTLVHDDKVEGTFSFTGSNMSELMNIEDGTFSSPITTKAK